MTNSKTQITLIRGSKNYRQVGGCPILTNRKRVFHLLNRAGAMVYFKAPEVGDQIPMKTYKARDWKSIELVKGMLL